MAGISISVTGMKEAQREITRVPVTLQSMMSRILRDSSLVAMDYAKSISPVVTGRYRSSIHIEQENSPAYSYTDKQGNTFDGSFETQADEGEILVGTNVNYASNVERLHSVIERARVKAQFYLTSRLNELTR